MNTLQDPFTNDASVNHYYGDQVRILFLSSAVFSFIGIPLWGNLLPINVTLQIVGGLLLVLLAGLTNPHNTTVMIGNAVASGLGALLIELTIIYNQTSGSLPLLVIREVEAVFLLLAFYLSVKSARAMLLGRLGVVERPWEFDKKIQGNDSNI
jgi:hypothetical protein